MGIEHILAKTFSMTDSTWERHANPLSVWTRYLTLPLLVGIIWSRYWLGYWCLVPLGTALLWLWINPRCFAKPSSTKSWASKAVLGERVWLNRKNTPLPKHHSVMPNALALAAGLGKIPLIYGLYFYDIQPLLWGLLFVNVFKSWFLDRMVWIFEDMKNRKEYSSWE